MKKILVLLSLFVASSLFAETWYGYCIATRNGARYCTHPEIKTGAMDARCLAFAKSLGATGYKIESSTDSEKLEDEMGEHCDVVKGPDTGSIYACQHAKLCPHSEPKIGHFASRVHADTKTIAIDRCTNDNHAKAKQKLQEASLSNCYFKMVVEKVN